MPPPAAEEYSAALRTISGREPAEALVMLRELLSERTAAQTAERRSLIGSLVELGAETPATAFAGGAPVARLTSEALPELRSRVAALRAARPAGAAPVPPPSGAGESDLSEVETRAANQIKDPEKRSAFVALRRSRKLSSR